MKMTRRVSFDGVPFMDHHHKNHHHHSNNSSHVSDQYQKQLHESLSEHFPGFYSSPPPSIQTPPLSDTTNITMPLRTTKQRASVSSREAAPTTQQPHQQFYRSSCQRYLNQPLLTTKILSDWLFDPTKPKPTTTSTTTVTTAPSISIINPAPSIHSPQSIKSLADLPGGEFYSQPLQQQPAIKQQQQQLQQPLRRKSSSHHIQVDNYPIIVTPETPPFSQTAVAPTPVVVHQVLPQQVQLPMVAQQQQFVLSQVHQQPQPQVSHDPYAHSFSHYQTLGTPRLTSQPEAQVADIPPTYQHAKTFDKAKSQKVPKRRQSVAAIPSRPKFVLQEIPPMTPSLLQQQHQPQMQQAIFNVQAMSLPGADLAILQQQQQQHVAHTMNNERRSSNNGLVNNKDNTTLVTTADNHVVSTIPVTAEQDSNGKKKQKVDSFSSLWINDALYNSNSSTSSTGSNGSIRRISEPALRFIVPSSDGEEESMSYRAKTLRQKRPSI